MELKRRELIAAFLGTTVLASACRSPVHPRSRVAGAIVDRGFELGHRLRSEAPASLVEAEPVEVLVVGAGVAGLSAAWRLSAAGVRDYRVLELERETGGTARSGENAISAFPWGAHYLPAPYRAHGSLARLLTEVGALTGVRDDGRSVYAEQMLIREPEERLFYRGSWYEGLYLHAGASAEDLSQLARFEAQMQAFAKARDARGRKAFEVPTALSSDDAEWTQLDRLSMAQWMEQQRFHSPRLKWLVDYACRDDFGSTPDQVSAWAGIWYFAARQGGGAERSEGYLSWPEGNGRLVHQLRSSLSPARVHTRWLVQKVQPLQTGVRVEAWDAVESRPRALMAQQVVFAGPRFVATRVVAPWQKDAPSWSTAFTYAPWVVANLSLKKAPRSRGFPLAWDNVFYESRSLGYVVATHQRLQGHEGGPTVLTWYLPLSGADVKAERERALSASYEDWEALVRADLAPAHEGFMEEATQLEVTRWGHAMVRPTPGFLWGGARQAAQQSLGERLHFAHSDLGGLGLFEEAHHFGVQAAERVLKGLKRTFEPW